jgi:hypothetical protein
MPTPIINNVAHDGGTAEIRFNTSAFGLQEIGWEAKVDKKKVRAIGATVATKRTRGVYEVSDPTVKMDTAEWTSMLEKMPANGYSDCEFTILVDYAHPDMGRQKVEMLQCCIIGEKDSIKEGSDATMKELTISCMQIKVNGKTMNKLKGTATTAGNNTLRL